MRPSNVIFVGRIHSNVVEFVISFFLKRLNMLDKDFSIRCALSFLLIDDNDSIILEQIRHIGTNTQNTYK